MSIRLAAWHSSQAFKDRILDLLRDDKEHDRYIQGIYLENPDANGEFRGCHIGCLMMAKLRVDRLDQPDGKRQPMSEMVGLLVTANVDKVCEWHDKVPAALGMPRQMAQLWDDMFEKMAPVHASEFAIRSLEAVPPGADLSKVVLQLVLWMINKVREEATDLTDAFKELIPELAALYERRIADDTPDDAEWRSVSHRLLDEEGPDHNQHESAIVCASYLRNHHDATAAASAMIDALIPEDSVEDADLTQVFPWVAAAQLFILCEQAPIVGVAAKP